MAEGRTIKHELFLGVADRVGLGGSTHWMRVPRCVRRAGRYLTIRIRLRISGLALLRGAGLRTLSVAVAIELLGGLLQPAFIVVISTLLAALPGVVRSGAGSVRAQALAPLLVVATLIFTARQVFTAVERLLSIRIAGRIDALARLDIMSNAFRPPSLAVLEQEHVRSNLHEIVDTLRWSSLTPGAGCAGALVLISRYTEALTSAALVAVAVAWWAGVGIAVAILTLRNSYRICLGRLHQVRLDHVSARRRRSYLRTILLDSAAGKEVRVYGLLDWLVSRYRAVSLETFRPEWSARRRIYVGPLLLSAAGGIALLSFTLGQLGIQSAHGYVAIGGLTLAVQAGLTSLRLGGYVHEADNPIEAGLRGHCNMRVVEREAEADARAHHCVTGCSAAGLPRRALRLENVSFIYPGQTAAVLRNVSFEVPTGTSLAVVGVNGAGKSTLVKLLAGLYEATTGRICVDGIDVRCFAKGAWSERVAIALQDFGRYPLSVADNVGFGASQSRRSQGALRTALAKAGAESLVAGLASGASTVVSPNYPGGVELSGGEWQRIAIARALMAVEAGAGVLLVDEPTASLDAGAEAQFVSTVLQQPGITTIVVSHRMSTVRHVDKIIVLDEGRIVETGSHSELVAREGLYAELFAAQTHAPATRAAHGHLVG